MRVARLGAVLAVGAAVVLARPGPAGASRAHGHRRSVCAAWSMWIHAPDHRPRVNRDWTLTVGLRPLSLVGYPFYQFLVAGKVVRTQYVSAPHRKHFSFRGRYSDPFRWSVKASGIPLTLRVVLRTRCGTQHRDWTVKVRK